jgi:hypothetical protein
MHVLIQDTCIAGIWRRNIEVDLGWYNENRFPGEDATNARQCFYCNPLLVLGIDQQSHKHCSCENANSAKLCGGCRPSACYR